MENNHNLDDGFQDFNRLPVPVQTFLWRQIAPFVRPKLGKLHEANCMVSAIWLFNLNSSQVRKIIVISTHIYISLIAYEAF